MGGHFVDCNLSPCSDFVCFPCLVWLVGWLVGLKTVSD